MLLTTAPLLLLLGLVSSHSLDLVLDSVTRLEWEAWKTTHSKDYSHLLEEQQRCEVWRRNKKMIDTHNAATAGTSGYTLAMNEFGDLVCSHACVYATYTVRLPEALW